MVVRLLNRRAQADTGPQSPTRTEQAVLAWLEDRGPLTPSGLAGLEHVRLQSIGQTVDALAERKWISRGAHPEDRRQILISITRAGQQALGKGRTMRQEWLEKAMKTLLNDQERRRLMDAIELLERIVQS
jgi:DNA-binding MarR family transcriptional regulator